MYQAVHLKPVGSGKYSVHLWDDKKGYSNFEWQKTAFVPDPTGHYTSLNGEKVTKTPFYFDNPVKYESDVPPDTKLLVELYSDSDEPAEWQHRLFFDIEVSMEGQLPDPMKGNNPITSIAYYDETADRYGIYILDEKNELQNRDTSHQPAHRYDVEKPSEEYELIRFDTEEELLTRFITKWQEIAPTIVTGWNIDFFDIPYLYNRIKTVLGEQQANRLSPVGIVEWNERKERYFIAGVNCLDYLPIYKNFTFTQLSSYRLDAVGEFELGYGKVEYEGTLDQLKENNIEKFIEYNIIDVKLIVEFEKKLKFLEQAVGITTVGHVPYENIYQSSKFLEGSILTYLRRTGNRVADEKPAFTADTGKFMGAYVKEPVPGRYDYIFDLDLTSMYPSIIMSLNISPETKVGKVYDWDFKEYNQGTEKNYKVQIYGDTTYEFSHSELRNMLDETKYSLSSNGILYRTDIEGIIPSILRTWFDERVESKNLMKKFGNEGNDEKYEYYKKRQVIQKVLLNSMYGCLGLKNWRWYDVDNALAVTATGQQVIKFSSDMANHYYNKALGTKDDWVIYTDTDSTFLSALPIIEKNFPDIDTDDEELMCSKISEVALNVQNFINESYNVMAKKMFNITKHRFDIKQENIARRGIWITKKRYVQKIIWENGVTKDDIDVKGLDVVRSDFPKAFKNFMKGILDDLLNGVDKEIVDKKIIEFRDGLSERPLLEVGKPTGVKGIKKYSSSDKRIGTSEKGTPAHVKSAIYYNDFLKLKNLDTVITPITDGEKIVWFYLKSNPLSLDMMALKGSDDPDEVVEFITKYFDYEKMFSKLLRKKILDFYEALKWESFENVNYKAQQFFSF